MKKFIELLFLKQLKGIGNTTINRKYIQLLEKVDSLAACADLVRLHEAKLSESDIETAIKITKKKYNEIITDSNISVITIFDDEYPKKLNDLKDKKPVILYAKGNINVLKHNTIAVVGTRKPSAWSEKVEYKMVQKMIELSGSVIVSGLALGCDRVAHEATIQANGITVAVLPSGVNVITPASHKKLANDILGSGGCIVSEYEPNAKVTKATYVERDGLIAALSDATMVIECDVKSGTMHTVEAAKTMKRKLACYYCEDESKGNYGGNHLIFQSKNATKISETDELLQFIKEVNNDNLNENTKEEICRQLDFMDLLKNDIN